ncbi:MAG: hypothetical protein LC131_05405 [Anaerolineae bacterium]|nr:hypothetical protein [Anaerolineae bacterium]
MSDTTPTAPLAPTRHEVASNPGAYDGTSFDPLLGIMHPQLYERFSRMLEGDRVEVGLTGPMSWADWYRKDPGGAMACFEDPGQYGEPLNISKLSTGQRVRMGLS